jgi:outer membrane receptor protein involved in Fe transport
MSFISGIELRFSSIQGDYYSSKQTNAQQTGSAQTNIPGGNVFFSKDIGAYFQTTINIFRKISLTAGTRYDFNRIRISEGYGSVFNYRLALVYFPSTFIFKAIYATAFKDATNREKIFYCNWQKRASKP